MPRWACFRDRRLAEDELLRRGLRAVGREDPLWPGQLATVAALVLYLFLPERLQIGPGWTVTAALAASLGALILATRAGGEAGRLRGAAIVLLLVATAASLFGLGVLTDYLVSGRAAARGTDLLRGGGIIWAIDLLLFAVLYWELDRGGPVRPTAGDRRPVAPDLLFPQMTAERYAEHDWMPRFGDYLYVSLTNQTAFSPTDTMPLTRRVKALMGIQGVAALVTAGVIVARAVNILT